MSEWVTYYAVKPLLMCEGGLRLGESVEVGSAARARDYEHRLNDVLVGVIAYYRSGNPGSGLWHDAVIIGIYGNVPDWAFDG